MGVALLWAAWALWEEVGLLPSEVGQLGWVSVTGCVGIGVYAASLTKRLVLASISFPGNPVVNV